MKDSFYTRKYTTNCCCSLPRLSPAYTHTRSNTIFMNFCSANIILFVQHQTIWWCLSSAYLTMCGVHINVYIYICMCVWWIHFGFIRIIALAHCFGTIFSIMFFFSSSTFALSSFYFISLQSTLFVGDSSISRHSIWKNKNNDSSWSIWIFQVHSFEIMHLVGLILIWTLEWSSILIDHNT